jgi:hypothetical protein
MEKPRMSLPNPQTLVDAQAVATFANAVSQSAVHLVTRPDKTTPEYSEMHTYFADNKSKLKDIIGRLETDLA